MWAVSSPYDMAEAGEAAWDESQHPRVPAGGKGGGEFTSKSERQNATQTTPTTVDQATQAKWMRAQIAAAKAAGAGAWVNLQVADLAAASEWQAGVELPDGSKKESWQAMHDAAAAAQSGKGGMLVGVADYGLEANPERLFSEAHALGLGVVRVSLRWDPGLTDMTSYQRGWLDRLGSNAGGTKVLATLSFGAGREAPLTDEARAQFAQWAASIVRSYPAISHVEVGNEPNLPLFWSPPNPAEYAKLLEAAYPALHQARPSVKVVGLSLAPHRNPYAFAKAVAAELGGRKVMDVSSFHAYGMGAPAMKAMVKFLRASFGNVPAWVTEDGLETSPSATAKSVLGEALWRQELHPRGRAGRFTFFHGTNVKLRPGELLSPAKATGVKPYLPDGTHYRDDLVYMTTGDHMAERYAVGRAGRHGGEPHVYEVEPVGQHFPDPEAQSGFGTDQYAAHLARVVREVPLPGFVHWDSETQSVHRGPAPVVLRPVSEFVTPPKSGMLAQAARHSLGVLDGLLAVPDLGVNIPIKATAGKNLRGGYARDEKGTVEVEKWTGPVVGRGRSALPAKRADEFVAGVDGHNFGYEVYPVVAIEPLPDGSLKFIDKSPTSEHTYERVYRPDDLVAFDWKPRVTGESQLAPAVIRVSSRQSEESHSPESTLVHELGHLIDNQAFRKNGGAYFASDHARYAELPPEVQASWIEQARERGDRGERLAARMEGYRDSEAALRDWYRAVMDTDAVDALSESSLADMATHRYLRSPRELWARSFFQWAATRSQDPELMEALRYWQNLPDETMRETENWKGEKTTYKVPTPRYMKHRQWQDADFEPVGRAMDALFERLGWRKWSS
jgi:hypothetical protein